MQIKIDINKMSTESREAYLIDLIEDLANALADNDKDAEVLAFAFKAIQDYHSKNH